MSVHNEGKKNCFEIKSQFDQKKGHSFQTFPQCTLSHTIYSCLWSTEFLYETQVTVKLMFKKGAFSAVFSKCHEYCMCEKANSTLSHKSVTV